MYIATTKLQYCKKKNHLPARNYNCKAHSHGNVFLDICVSQQCVSMLHMALLLLLFLSAAASIEPAFNVTVRRSPTLAL